MEINVEITDAAVNTRGGKTRNGDDWSIREQQAWLHLLGKRYPQEFVMQLRDQDSPYHPGLYKLLMSSITIGKFGKLEFHRFLDLERIKETA